MSKEKVFIIVSHKNSPKKGSHPGSSEKVEVEWEVTEHVEFVNQIRNKHISMASAIGDYINKKMITGARFGITEYDKFEEYVRTKYKKQMEELDAAYRAQQVVEEESPEVFVDAFGNIRARTVFDPV
jgi:hypothetical protein